MHPRPEILVALYSRDRKRTVLPPQIKSARDSRRPPAVYASVRQSLSHYLGIEADLPLLGNGMRTSNRCMCISSHFVLLASDFVALRSPEVVLGRT